MATFIEKNTQKLKEHALDKMFARQQQINGNAGSASGDIPQAQDGFRFYNTDIKRPGVPLLDGQDNWWNRLNSVNYPFNINNVDITGQRPFKNNTPTTKYNQAPVANNSNFAQGQINLSNTQGMNPVPDKVDLGIKPFNYGSLNEQPKSNTFYTNAKDNPDLPGFKPSPAGANALNWGKVGTFAGQIAPMVYNMAKGLQKPEKTKPNYNPYESRIRSLMNDRRFNIEPLLNSNLTAQAVANRNIMNAGNSRGELMGNLGAAQNYRMIGDASAWATKNNMDNQYLEEQARMDYMLGQGRSQMDWMTQDANARNKAATNQFMGQGFNDLGKFSQMQQLMANQHQNSRDQMRIWQDAYGGGAGTFMTNIREMMKEYGINPNNS